MSVASARHSRPNVGPNWLGCAQIAPFAAGLGGKIIWQKRGGVTVNASVSARGRWAAAALAIAGLAIGLAATSSPPYRSRAIVLMPPGMTHTGRFDQAMLVTSNRVLADAARRLGHGAGPAGLRDRISVTLPARATA